MISFSPPVLHLHKKRTAFPDHVSASVESRALSKAANTEYCITQAHVYYLMSAKSPEHHCQGKTAKEC
jgi:hypothetical protein